MFGIPVNVLVAAGVMLLGVLLTFKDWIPGVLGSAVSLVKRSPAKPDRKTALGKCDDCIAYLESIGCTEGVAYFKDGLVHLYHSH